MFLAAVGGLWEENEGYNCLFRNFLAVPHNCAALPLCILHKKGEKGLLESVVFSSLTNVFA